MSNAQDNAAHTCSYSCDRPECIKAQRDELAAAAAQGIDLATAWAEGYRSGVMDERISESNIGIAGFGAKIEPARANPYMIDASPKGDPEHGRIDPSWSLHDRVEFALRDAGFDLDEAAFVAEAASVANGDLDSPKGGSEARDAALNTLAIMFHNSEEMEGPDGMAVSIDLALWHEALEAYEVLIGDYDEVTLATSAQAQASDAEVRPMPEPEPEGDEGCLHEFVAFRSDCIHCGEKYVAPQANSHGAGVDK